MVTDSPDRLDVALASLRSDVETLQLRPPSDVRSRGDQRTHRGRLTLAAGTVAAVAAVAAGAVSLPSLLSSPDTVRPLGPAGSGSVRPTVSPSAASSTGTDRSPSATSTRAPTSASTSAPTRPSATVTVRPVGPGSVPRAYFLPGGQWAGPALDDGQQVESVALKDSEGSVQYADCDVDADYRGDAGIVQAQHPSGTFVGTQKVRLLGSTSAAAKQASRTAAGVSTCQQRLRAQAAGGTSPTVDVVEDAAGAVTDATGTTRLFRTLVDQGTGGGSQSAQWVVVAREGRAVTTLTVQLFPETKATAAALRRIGAAARAQMAAAQG